MIAGRVTKVESRRIHYMLDTAGGQSGSPTWRYRDGKRHAVGIHAYGGCPNKSTRINEDFGDLDLAIPTSNSYLT